MGDDGVFWILGEDVQLSHWDSKTISDTKFKHVFKSNKHKFCAAVTASAGAISFVAAPLTGLTTAIALAPGVGQLCHVAHKNKRIHHFVNGGTKFYRGLEVAVSDIKIGRKRLGSTSRRTAVYLNFYKGEQQYSAMGAHLRKDSSAGFGALKAKLSWDKSYHELKKYIRNTETREGQIDIVAADFNFKHNKVDDVEELFSEYGFNQTVSEESYSLAYTKSPLETDSDGVVFYSDKADQDEQLQYDIDHIFTKLDSQAQRLVTSAKFWRGGKWVEVSDHMPVLGVIRKTANSEAVASTKTVSNTKTKKKKKKKKKKNK